MNLVVYPQKKPLTGTVSIPGDKSISHRAIMLASLADGDSIFRHWLPAGDTLAALESMRALGVEIEAEKRNPSSWDLIVHGRGMNGLRQPESALDCRNAGTLMRLMSGIAAGQQFPMILDGSDQLRQRPMSRITNPLRHMGANIEDNNGRAPLSFRPSSLESIDYQMPVASAQVKSAVLLAALYADGQTIVHEPGPTRDHTERMLGAMGIEVVVQDKNRSIEGPVTKLAPLDMTIPGDFSSAAFLMAAATIVPHSDVTIEGVGINETRTGFFDILETMGARVELSDKKSWGGEPAAHYRCRFEELDSAEVSGDTVVRAIDEFPVWTVAATQAAGKSVLSEASELKVKEVDRIALVAVELSKMGGDIEEMADGLSISGPTRLHGAEVNSHGDHRLGMALAVAGLAASSPTTIRNASCIADSFPEFVETFQALGANLHWQD
jgi:3-phosphoshikimate 1-carboxyvinyltransferase